MKQPISEVFNGDCMEYMAGLPDKFFDLVIADPPYGIGASEGYARSLRMNKKITEKKWDNSAPALKNTGQTKQACSTHRKCILNKPNSKYE